MDLFPFTKIRGGQKDFLADVKKTVEKGGHIVAHAPTGIGKTVAALTPALEHALTNGQTIFFLTPKHTQHTIVVDTLKKISSKHKTTIASVDFIGKQWMCPHQVTDVSNQEFHEYCRTRKKDETCEHYANAHKKRSQGKVKELVDSILTTPHHSEKIQAECAKNKFCPYEICVRAGNKADVIIADYFHLMVPSIREAFLAKLGKNLADSIIIVDEAHNLPERIRKILSVNLSDAGINRAAKEASVLGYTHLVEDLEILSKTFRRLKRKLKKEECYVRREELSEPYKEKAERSLADLSEELLILGEEILSIPNRVRSSAKSVGNFLTQWGGVDLGYTRILRYDKKLVLSYGCLDPSFGTKPVFDAVHASILMSGTLTPAQMYSSLLGLKADKTIERLYPSPFPRENRLTMIIAGVTSKYSERSDFMYRKMSWVLAEQLACIPGNSAVFFPAYEFMETILAQLKRLRVGREFIVEKKEMGKSERKKLYEKLTTPSENGRILMGVQAGSFSEGVDYPGGLLSAVFVVGLPLERPNLETQALIDYYDFRFERGWDFGYIYPAMNRALQAAGRCIRSEDDRGAIILMDERFRWANYAKCFPPDYEFIVTEKPIQYLQEFFDESTVHSALY